MSTWLGKKPTVPAAPPPRTIGPRRTGRLRVSTNSSSRAACSALHQEIVARRRAREALGEACGALWAGPSAELLVAMAALFAGEFLHMVVQLRGTRLLAPCSKALSGSGDVDDTDQRASPVPSGRRW